jgi:hypothetical protein
MEKCRNGKLQSEEILDEQGTGEELGKFLANVNQSLHMADGQYGGQPEIEKEKANMTYKFFVIMTIR